MGKFFAGVLIGIVLATVGLKGVAHYLNEAAPVVDKKVDELKSSVKSELGK